MQMCPKAQNQLRYNTFDGDLKMKSRVKWRLKFTIKYMYSYVIFLHVFYHMCALFQCASLIKTSQQNN